MSSALFRRRRPILLLNTTLAIVFAVQLLDDKICDLFQRRFSFRNGSHKDLPDVGQAGIDTLQAFDAEISRPRM
jgi:hypothetical protein